MYAEADRDRLAFWAAQAERLDWETPWTQVNNDEYLVLSARDILAIIEK